MDDDRPIRGKRPSPLGRLHVITPDGAGDARCCGTEDRLAAYVDNHGTAGGPDETAQFLRRYSFRHVCLRNHSEGGAWAEAFGGESTYAPDGRDITAAPKVDQWARWGQWTGPSGPVRTAVTADVRKAALSIRLFSFAFSGLWTFWTWISQVDFRGKRPARCIPGTPAP
jgi:hypothetical protein